MADVLDGGQESGSATVTVYALLNLVSVYGNEPADVTVMLKISPGTNPLANTGRWRK